MVLIFILSVVIWSCILPIFPEIRAELNDAGSITQIFFKNCSSLTYKLVGLNLNKINSEEEIFKANAMACLETPFFWWQRSYILTIPYKHPYVMHRFHTVLKDRDGGWTVKTLRPKKPNRKNVLVVKVLSSGEQQRVSCKVLIRVASHTEDCKIGIKPAYLQKSIPKQEHRERRGTENYLSKSNDKDRDSILAENFEMYFKVTSATEAAMPSSSTKETLAESTTYSSTDATQESFETMSYNTELYLSSESTDYAKNDLMAELVDDENESTTLNLHAPTPQGTSLETQSLTDLTTFQSDPSDMLSTPTSALEPHFSSGTTMTLLTTVAQMATDKPSRTSTDYFWNTTISLFKNNSKGLNVGNPVSTLKSVSFVLIIAAATMLLITSFAYLIYLALRRGRNCIIDKK